eukprot:1195955-Pleurochrysis_carterae.AAC.1
MSANHHPFPHAVDSTLEVAAAGFRSQPPRALMIYQLDHTAPFTGRLQGVLVQRRLVVRVVLVSRLQQSLVA